MPDEPTDGKPRNSEAMTPSQFNESPDTPSASDETPPPRDDRPFDQPMPENPTFVPTPEVDIEPATIAAEPPLAVTSQQFQEPVANTLQSPKPKSNKKLLVGVILAAVFVLLGAGSVLAYNMWYQNPQKVLGDAIANSMTATSVNLDAEIKTESKPYTPSLGNSMYEGAPPDMFKPSTALLTLKADANYEIAQLDVEYVIDTATPSSKVSGGAVLDYKNGAYYLKVNEVSKLLEFFFGSSDQAPAEITSLIKKIDGNWIKFTDEDINEVSGATTNDNVSSCVQNVVEKVSTDDISKNELTDIYRKNSILVVTKNLGSKDGSIGYEIEPSYENTNAFIKAFNTSKFYNDIKKCDDSIKDVEPMKKSTIEKDASEAKVSVWISRWSHELKKITTSSDSEYSASSSTVDVQFNQPLKAEVPKNTIELKTLQDEIEKAQGLFFERTNEMSYVEGAAAAVGTSSTFQAQVNTIAKKAEIYYAYNAKYPSYDEFIKGNVNTEEAKLDADTKLVLSKKLPSESDSKSIQYEQCNNGAGATIRYYSQATRSVTTNTLGSCTTT